MRPIFGLSIVCATVALLLPATQPVASQQPELLPSSQGTTLFFPHVTVNAGNRLIFLDTLAGLEGQAMAINNQGQVAGWNGRTFGRHETGLADRDSFAVLWDAGVVVDLGTLGGQAAHATAINNHGHVVGRSDTGTSGHYHAFLWVEGVMTDLGTLGGSRSQASGINDHGQVVGWSETASHETHAFLWENGVMIDLGTSGHTGSYANDINNDGQIVGWVETVVESHRAVLWEDRVMRELARLGGTSQARGINDHGQVVGRSQMTSGASHAVLWDGEDLIDLGTLAGGQGSSIAYAINNHGQVVGQSQGFYGPLRAFFWVDGVMIDLGALGGSTWASGINDLGEATGYFVAGLPEGGWKPVLWLLCEDIHPLCPQTGQFKMVDS